MWYQSSGLLTARWCWSISSRSFDWEEFAWRLSCKLISLEEIVHRGCRLLLCLCRLVPSDWFARRLPEVEGRKENALQILLCRAAGFLAVSLPPLLIGCWSDRILFLHSNGKSFATELDRVCCIVKRREEKKIRSSFGVQIGTERGNKLAQSDPNFVESRLQRICLTDWIKKNSTLIGGGRLVSVRRAKFAISVATVPRGTQYSEIHSF